MASPEPSRVVAFGELLLRLTSPGHERLTQARQLEVRYTGAEANAAVSLVLLGHSASAVSVVPAHAVGDACLAYLRQFGVDTRHVVRGGDRLGTLYVEQGAGQRASQVIYDREHSGFQEADPGVYDWDAILDDCAWLHFSGTAPSRGANVVRAVAEGSTKARERGIPVSCDVNYRSRLWDEATAQSVLRELLSVVTHVLCGRSDAELLLGEPAPGDVADVAARLRDGFGLEAAVLSERSGSSASEGGLHAALANRDGRWTSRDYDLAMVDRIGGGDALTAGAIHGWLTGMEPQRLIDFAVAAAALKHTIPGDFNLATLDEIEALLEGQNAARVRR